MGQESKMATVELPKNIAHFSFFTTDYDSHDHPSPLFELFSVVRLISNSSAINLFSKLLGIPVAVFPSDLSRDIAFIAYQGLSFTIFKTVRFSLVRTGSVF